MASRKGVRRGAIEFSESDPFTGDSICSAYAHFLCRESAKNPRKESKRVATDVGEVKFCRVERVDHWI